ncbi:MAG: hypothetical protein KDJ86_00580 [Bauldia sp.]|uniref:hypothetical protein n=1 Tax=Bauldia sp. TaxID=2575872 RepID=UPI001DD60AE1|nr:hypothetical protein [Bauldia sp.]MCB1494252.1 hypothetical protein [Bauldia sp.]
MYMRLILALLTLAATVTMADAGAGKRMLGPEIRLALTGITLDGVYSDSLFFSETYFDDGLIRYHDINGADTGEWTVEDDTFCTFYESLSGACFFVERDGENCFTFFEAVEDDKGMLHPAAEWTSRGWNRDEESTCPTPPEAEI